MRRKTVLNTMMLGAVAAMCLSVPVAADVETKKLDMSQFEIVEGTFLNRQDRGAQILFDTQEVLPDKPIEDRSIQATGATYSPCYNDKLVKPAFYVDLGAYYNITDIGIMDMNAAPTITIYAGDPSGWDEIGSMVLNNYKNYRNMKLSNEVKTRYLRVEYSGTDSGVNEMAFYGYKAADITEEEAKQTGAKPSTAVQSNLTSGAKIGSCTFCDDPYTAMDALGNTREYYSWSWVVAPDGTFQFNHIVNKDNYYKTLHEMGKSSIPCVQFTTQNYLQEGEVWEDIKNNIPVEEGADTTDPRSYALHSSFMYNFAARYGSNKEVDVNTLSVTKGTEVLVGLGYLDAVESFNEENKTWEDKASYFTPEEYAAMLSADYDGHEGAIENGGVKKADPTFRLAMGGLVGADENVINYLQRMKDWFDYNRQDGKFCVDIINVHAGFYDTDCPEYSEWLTNMAKLQAWVDENVPETEIWVSEFDVKVSDLVNEDRSKKEEYEEERAQRLLRAYLIGEAAGVDRMSMFQLRDEWSGVYARAGLTTGKGAWNKKLAWYYIACGSDTLSNVDLVDTYESEDIYQYTYQDRDTSEKIYAIWSPTTNETTIEDYTLEVGDYQKATVVIPSDGVKEGEKSVTQIVNGIVTLDVSETVTFVKVSNEDVPYDNYPQKKIQVQKMRLGEQNGSQDTLKFNNAQVINLAKEEKPDANNFMLTQFYHLFDEQGPDKTAWTPWVTVSAKPTTEMGNLSIKNQQHYPYDCIVSFDDYYDITYIGMYDTFATGKMEIYDNETNTLIYTSKLDTYNCWKLVPMTSNLVSTNCVRIVKYDTAKLNELSFYGYPSYSKVGYEVEPVIGDVGEPEEVITGLGEEKRVAIDSMELGQLSLAAPRNQASILTCFKKLFDEQEKTPESTVDEYMRSNAFSSSFGNVYHTDTVFPYDYILNFSKEEHVSSVGVFLEWGQLEGNLQIYDAQTDECLLDTTLSGYNKWVVIPLEKEAHTSRLRVVKGSSKTLCEIAIYSK